MEFAKAIAKLSRITASLANRQHQFETYILAFNEQMLKQQIENTRRSIENRKLILSRDAHQAQLALQEYNSRKLILRTLKTLKNIPALRNDTIYKNQIQNGIIQNTEIYKIIKQGEENLTLWKKQHPLIIKNQSIRLEQFNKMKQKLKEEDQFQQNIKILQELATITVKPFEIFNFTDKYEPIIFPGADISSGISGVLKTVSDTGLQILEKGTNLVRDVVSTGLSVISTPIKIIIIAASIVGGIILLLLAYKFIYKGRSNNVEINMVTHIPAHPHIWKHHDIYYKKTMPRI